MEFIRFHIFPDMFGGFGVTEGFGVVLAFLWGFFDLLFVWDSVSDPFISFLVYSFISLRFGLPCFPSTVPPLAVLRHISLSYICVTLHTIIYIDFIFTGSQKISVVFGTADTLGFSFTISTSM